MCRIGTYCKSFLSSVLDYCWPHKCAGQMNTNINHVVAYSNSSQYKLTHKQRKITKLKTQ